MSEATNDPAELLSASQIAALLHVRKQDALDLIAAGEIPTVRIGQYRHRRVLRQSLIAWLKSKEVIECSIG